MSEVDYIYLRSDGVSRLAILTLIYRAIPVEPGSSSTFIPECIQTARAALELHQVCIGSLKEASENLRCSYMHWYVSRLFYIPSEVPEKPFYLLSLSEFPPFASHH